MEIRSRAGNRGPPRSAGLERPKPSRHRLFGTLRRVDRCLEPILDAAHHHHLDLILRETPGAHADDGLLDEGHGLREVDVVPFAPDVLGQEVQLEGALEPGRDPLSGHPPDLMKAETPVVGSLEVVEATNRIIGDPHLDRARLIRAEEVEAALATRPHEVTESPRTLYRHLTTCLC
jgi:hypothetical protein